MASSKNLLYFLLLLVVGTSFILQSEARARPFGGDDDDDDDEFFKDDQEEEVQESKPDERSLHGGSSSDHKEHMLALLNNSPDDDSSALKAGFSGGSVSNYNETCDNKACNQDRNLRCDQIKPKPWRCECLIGHIYIRSQEKCYPIWNTVSQTRCEFHEQCENGPSGQLSRCNHVKGSCECFDTMTGGKNDVVLHNNVCVTKRNINESCTVDAECQSTMKHNSVCSPVPNAINLDTEVCQCLKDYVWDPLIEECLKIADKGLASECKSQFQCTASNMGDLSRCNTETKKCECHDPKNPGQDNIAFYEKTGACFERKYWNSTCDEHDECKASISTEAVCSPQKDEGFGGTMLLICQCPEGKKCPALGEGGGALALRSFNSVIFAMLLLYRFCFRG